jgi:hypothetical protein
VAGVCFIDRVGVGQIRRLVPEGGGAVAFEILLCLAASAAGLVGGRLAWRLQPSGKVAAALGLLPPVGGWALVAFC